MEEPRVVIPEVRVRPPSPTPSNCSGGRGTLGPMRSTAHYDQNADALFESHNAVRVEYAHGSWASAHLPAKPGAVC